METSCDAIQNVTGIYLITNQINNKKYIGQSTNIYRRWMEHLRSGQPDKYSKKSIRDSNTPIHKAMQKYGVENFTIQLLEKCSKEELNVKEKFWINELKTDNCEVGYNITKGGQDNFALQGEKHSQAKLTQLEVNEIIYTLQNDREIKLENIANQYNVSKSTICMINTGKTWHNNNLNYPLRPTYVGSKGSKNPRAQFTEEQVMEIRELYSQGYTLKTIPDKYKKIASDSAIQAIMYGKTYKHLPIWNKKLGKWIEPCIDYPLG